jgi:hypothetical protein
MTTIEFFNLNHPPLVNARRSAVKPLQGLLELANLHGYDELIEFVRRQRDELGLVPHATPIRQFLTALIGSP